jgi:hypothetical protein
MSDDDDDEDDDYPIDVRFAFDSPDGTHTVIVEDDRQTGYAYLHDETKEVVAHVWLYNHDGPLTITRGRPFPNQPELMTDIRMRPLTKASDVQCQWDDVGVNVIVDGVDVARLERGSPVGWSRYALADGRLALRWKK